MSSSKCYFGQLNQQEIDWIFKSVDEALSDEFSPDDMFYPNKFNNLPEFLIFMLGDSLLSCREKNRKKKISEIFVSIVRSEYPNVEPSSLPPPKKDFEYDHTAFLKFTKRMKNEDSEVTKALAAISAIHQGRWKSTRPHSTEWKGFLSRRCAEMCISAMNMLLAAKKNLDEQRPAQQNSTVAQPENSWSAPGWYENYVPLPKPIPYEPEHGSQLGEPLYQVGTNYVTVAIPIVCAMPNPEVQQVSSSTDSPS